MIDGYYKQSFIGSKVIPTLRDQYKNIDIRAIYAKNKDNPQWRCAFLKVYFTRDSRELIEDIHREKHDLLSTNNPNLEFQSECKDITAAESLLKEINNMNITINGIKATLHPYSQNLFDSSTKLSINNNVLKLYTIISKLENYPHAFISIESSETPAGVLTFLGFKFKDHVYRNLDTDIETFVDTSGINSSNRNGIIVFPIYFKELRLDPTEQLNHITKFEIHKSLLPHCRLTVNSIRNGRIVGRIDSNNLESIQNDDRIVFNVSRESVNIERNSLLRIELNLPNIEQNLEYELGYDEMISTDKVLTNPLPFIFNLLSNANRNLSIYLNSGDEKQQVIGASWLLSMLGVIHLNLGIISSDDERIYDGKTYKGAADTISFENSIGTLIIDFTSSPPKQNKIDKIRNAANYIHERLSIKVTPLIICNTECHDSKTSVSDVVIMDKNDTDKFIELILDNKTEKAKQFFQNIMNVSDVIH